MCASGHLSVLQWARANGCPWCAMACSDVSLGVEGDTSDADDFKVARSS
jgi:hypothetical protein